MSFAGREAWDGWGKGAHPSLEELIVSSWDKVRTLYTVIGISPRKLELVSPRKTKLRRWQVTEAMFHMADS